MSLSSAGRGGSRTRRDAQVLPHQEAHVRVFLSHSDRPRASLWGSTAGGRGLHRRLGVIGEGTVMGECITQHVLVKDAFQSLSSLRKLPESSCPSLAQVARHVRKLPVINFDRSETGIRW